MLVRVFSDIALDSIQRIPSQPHKQRHSNGLYSNTIRNYDNN